VIVFCKSRNLDSYQWEKVQILDSEIQGESEREGQIKKPDKASLAVRILERLAGRRLKYFDSGCPISGEMPMGQLRRALNAYRLVGWDQAVDVCKQFGAISIDQNGTVKLLGVPSRLIPPPPPPTRKSAGRYRSERDLPQRRAWVMKKRLEAGEDLEEIEDDEPRDDVKEWLASLQMQGSKG
jgi:hypothetical protein